MPVMGVAVNTPLLVISAPSKFARRDIYQNRGTLVARTCSASDGLARNRPQLARLARQVAGGWLGTKGYTDTIQKDGFPPLRDVMQSFVANGGQIWVCGTCAKPRGIGEADLIEGAHIVTAANVVERMAQGAATLDS